MFHKVAVIVIRDVRPNEKEYGVRCREYEEGDDDGGKHSGDSCVPFRMLLRSCRRIAEGFLS